MALNFLAVAGKLAGVAGAATPIGGGVSAVAGVASAVVKSASKILARKADRARRKAEEARMIAARREDVASKIDQITGMTKSVSSTATMPIKASAKNLLGGKFNSVQQRAVDTGAVLVPSGTAVPGKGMNLGLILAIGAGLFLLPKLLKR